MKRRHLSLIGVLLVMTPLISSCGIFKPSTPTPIYVTATPRIVVVTATASPVATPVLAPTLPENAIAELNTVLPPSPTPTRLITLTPTFTPTPTDTPPTPGVNPFGPVGVGSGIGGGSVAFNPGTCVSPPAGGFGTIYASNPTLVTQISCPIDQAVSVNAAYQPFERGSMVWVSQVGTSGQPGIYVFYNNSTYQRFIDTWREGIDPNSGGQVAPAGLQEPVRGFGKVWRESGGVKDLLGWATGRESGGTAVIQVFERGEMVYLSMTGQTYIAIAGTPGTWSAVAVPY